MAHACARLHPLLRRFAAGGREALLLPASLRRKAGESGQAAATAAAEERATRRPAAASVSASSVLRWASQRRAAASSGCSRLSNSSISSSKNSNGQLLMWLEQRTQAGAARTPVFARPTAAPASSYENLSVSRRLLSSSASTAASASSSSSSSASSSSSVAAAAPDEEDAYHAGLVHTEFSNELHISKDTPVIPIFRVLNYEGKLTEGWQAPFSNEEVLDVYQFMVKLSIWDNLFYHIQRQGRISFYIQNQGEEALQVAVGKVLDPRDHLFCQYRELGVLLLHGLTDDDVLDQLFARKGDESKGRQMPISYSKRSINLHTICTPLTTQVPHAAGAGYAFKINGENRVAVAFFGEGVAALWSACELLKGAVWEFQGRRTAEERR